jgi:cytochrome c-type biogenesis protein CcmF
MEQYGHFCLCLAWLLSLLAVCFGVGAGINHKRNWLGSVANLTILVGAFTTLSLVFLAALFIQNDYSIRYVAQFSDRDMSWIYKVTAIWGGMDGSMLLWCAGVALAALAVAIRVRQYPRLLMPWVLAVLNSSTLFFLTVVVFFTNPFEYVSIVPPNGNGLNPLLQNPYMAIHPPMLYLGFTFLTVPYAFCLGAMFSGQLTNEWIRLTRRWTLIAWGFLTAGICLGGYWAYIELGWGGFWAWDPVENASFLPWLTSTAFLHSVMVQERKSMLKVWNVWLIVISYCLTVFGTFLTRSGVVQSVHAFASTNIGWIFLLYLGIILTMSVALTLWRRKELRPDRKIESFLSREAAFLVNNLLFLSICLATLWGVLFPVFSEAITGEKQAVGIPFFNTVNVPLFLMLIFMMGVGPLIAWKKASWKNLKKSFLMPLIGGIVSGGMLIWAGITEFYPVLSYSLCFFVLLTIIGEFHRSARNQRAIAGGQASSAVGGAVTLLRRHRIRYGGHLIHLGVLFATVGITASMAHKVERQFALAQGERFELGRFAFQLEAYETYKGRNYEATRASIAVSRRVDGEALATLLPEQRFYPRGTTRMGGDVDGEWTTEVALRKSLREDVYIVLAGPDESGKKLAFKVYINPLQVWLWIGIGIMGLGMFVVLAPERRSQQQTSPAVSKSAATLK